MSQHLILASASPQRKRLLEGLGLAFETHVSSVDESLCKETDPAERAGILAEQKAKDVAGHFSDSFVIGCDTLVVASDGTLLEKAANDDDARIMIQKLSGVVSIVHSALCIVAPGGKSFHTLSSSSVHFKELTSEEIDWWIGTGLWRDRSGSFQIDGPGQLMIEHLEGDWTSVVGLPVFALGELLKEAGYRISF